MSFATKSRWVTAVAAVAALATLSCGPAHATLVGRDCDAAGHHCQAVYDTVANLTWDGNLSDTSVLRDRDEAIAWAAGVTIDGFKGWSLPTYAQYGSLYAYGGPTSADGYGSPLFAGTLASVYFSPAGSLETNLWISDAITNSDDYYKVAQVVWTNSFAGLQTTYDPAMTRLSALAVRSGDVAAAVSGVPEPSTIGLIFAGLAGLTHRGRKARTRRC